MDSGFMAKVGKLIPIKDPEVKNFFITNPTILEVLLFHCSFIRIKLPVLSYLFQLLGSIKKLASKYLRVLGAGFSFSGRVSDVIMGEGT